MKTTYSRHERRTRGKFILKRLAELKQSQILKEADLSGLPEDVVKALTTGTCENKVLQKRYNTCKRIVDELFALELELKSMQRDLAKKKGLLNPSEETIRNVD
jgi:hypothetical protein